jgi:hypothetical protein
MLLMFSVRFHFVDYLILLHQLAKVFQRRVGLEVVGNRKDAAHFKALSQL